jgi:hypothetical protein
VPGSGLTTVMGKLPADEMLPVTVSFVEETKVVVSGVVPRKALAPDTNLLPVAVMLKFPLPMLAGLMPVRAGVGFSSVTALELVAELEAELVALTVTVFGFGRVAGAV